MNTSAVIASTIRDVDGFVDDFVDYHLAIGFEKIFLFLDDPGETVPPRIADNTKVTVIRNDAHLHLNWQDTPGFERFRPFIEREVMARQCLNCEHAMRLATEQGYGWLLHIDLDELFMVRGQSLAEHFARLSERSIGTVIYRNFEGVPETLDCGSVFRDISLFRVNPKKMDRLRFSEAQQAVINATGMMSLGTPFLLYANGKSVVRLEANLVCGGVHRFQRDDSTGDASAKWTLAHAGDNQLLLHYACSNFDAFVKKYKTLGRFADNWFDDVTIPFPFHRMARDVVATGDLQKMEQLFRKHVMLEGLEDKDKLLKLGVLARIGEAVEQLNTPGTPRGESR